MALDARIERRIRLLIPDTEAVFGDGEDEYIFSSEEIEDFYAEGLENVKCAAGLAKIQIGSAEAFVLKVARNYETATDGAKLMAQWVAAGEKLYSMGMDEISALDANEGIFDIAFPEYSQRHPEGMSHGSYRLGGWL